jgi:ATP-binding cassette subfamily F protein 3
MLLLTFSNVTFSYGGNLVLDEVAFEIQHDAKIGLVGENGGGKSTIFRLIAGEEHPLEGTIFRAQGLRIGYLRQEPDPADAAKTVLEAVSEASPELAAVEKRLRGMEERMADPKTATSPAALEKVLAAYSDAQARLERLGGYDFDHRVRTVLAGLGFDERHHGQRIGTLSGGEKKMVGLARLLLETPDLLLLDEPDNHLDLEAKAWLEGYIRDYAGAVCIISHDRHLLDQVVSEIFQVEDGQVSVYHGNYSAYITERQHRLLSQQQFYELQQREIRRLEVTLRDLKQWARQNPKFAPRAESMEKRVERAKREAVARPSLDRKKIAVDLDAQRSGKKVLEIRRLAQSIDARRLFGPFDLDVQYGERLGIVGPNGSGKTTLLRLITGTLPPDAGSIRIGAGVVAGYYSQEQETLPMDSTPVEFLRSLRPMTGQQAFAKLRRLLFSESDMSTPIARLSGGEKSRLQIARLMLTEANLLLLDEPTNNLDIPSVEMLEAALEEFGGTILTVSHDRYFMDKIVDRVIAIEDDCTVTHYPGNFSYYASKRAEGSSPSPRGRGSRLC